MSAGGPTAGRLRLVLSSPYAERALRAIRRAAADAGSLHGEYICRLPGFGSADPAATPRSTLGELIRLAGGRTGNRRLALKAMWSQKRLFDRAVSRESLDGVHALLAMPGAAGHSFRANPSRVRILHQVDAHPRAHNERLLDVFPRRHVRAELYSSALVDRLCAEIELASLVLCPSTLVIQQFLSAGADGTRLRRVPYGVDMELFRPMPAVGRAAGRPRVVFVGQISLRKGIPFLTAAARGLDVDVDLVGHVFDRRLVSSLPENVHVRGRVPHLRLPALFAECDALVLPTLEDACGLVATEAAACGLHVITTSASGAAELLPSSARVVPPGDVVALRSALRDVTVLSTDDRVHRRAALTHEDAAIRDWASYGATVLAEISGAAAGRS